MNTAAELKAMRLQAEAARGASQKAGAALAVRARERQIADARNRRMGSVRLHAMEADMRRAAEAGKTALVVLSFPSDICKDGGRAINSASADWAATLQGEAADLYAYYDGEMRAQGYRLLAAVQDFPNGMPGDIGLTIAGAEGSGATLRQPGHPRSVSAQAARSPPAKPHTKFL